MEHNIQNTTLVSIALWTYLSQQEKQLRGARCTNASGDHKAMNKSSLCSCYAAAGCTARSRTLAEDQLHPGRTVMLLTLTTLWTLHQIPPQERQAHLQHRTRKLADIPSPAQHHVQMRYYQKDLNCMHTFMLEWSKLKVLGAIPLPIPSWTNCATISTRSSNNSQMVLNLKSAGGTLDV